MALNKITYEDKVSLNPQPSIANKNKVSDADMNEIKAVVNQVVEDTGWVDISSYVNTNYFTARSDNKPMARRIGKQLFFKGYVYCTTNVGNKIATLMNSLPQQFRPNAEYSSGSIIWDDWTPYNMWIGASGAITIGQNTNIVTKQNWQGYGLSNLTGALTD